MTPPLLGLPWTPEDAACVLGPPADAGLLRLLLAELGVPQAAPGRWDAAELLGLHLALSPWLARRAGQSHSPPAGL
jgi:hypothetical protein